MILLLSSVTLMASRPLRLRSSRPGEIQLGLGVDAVYAYLQQNGVESEKPKIAPYGMKQLYVSDPDGYNVCFQWQAEKEVAAG